MISSTFMLVSYSTTYPFVHSLLFLNHVFIYLTNCYFIRLFIFQAFLWITVEISFYLALESQLSVTLFLHFNLFNEIPLHIVLLKNHTIIHLISCSEIALSHLAILYMIDCHFAITISDYIQICWSIRKCYFDIILSLISLYFSYLISCL